jgi:hypothetical protein
MAAGLLESAKAITDENGRFGRTFCCISRGVKEPPGRPELERLLHALTEQAIDEKVKRPLRA